MQSFMIYPHMDLPWSMMSSVCKVGFSHEGGPALCPVYVIKTAHKLPLLHIGMLGIRPSEILNVVAFLSVRLASVP